MQRFDATKKQVSVLIMSAQKMTWAEIKIMKRILKKSMKMMWKRIV